ncbi:hypothetical protein [Vibrio sp.]|uniref:hypothetical protein n=1 Tax=Vibrio sp. TaxID=678 RepID=UPI003D0E7D73
MKSFIVKKQPMAAFFIFLNIPSLLEAEAVLATFRSPQWRLSMRIGTYSLAAYLQLPVVGV